MLRRTLVPALGAFLTVFVLLLPLRQAPLATVYSSGGQLVSDPVFIGAGDIAYCGSDNPKPGAYKGTHAEATANLIASVLTANPTAVVFTAGDDAYHKGSDQQFANCYDPTWGRFKERTRPTPGNHEYGSSKAAPYYRYFKDQLADPSLSGPPSREYYSYNLGAWHIVALNSEIAADKNSAQETWLRTDLAANKRKCTLAYWHKPVFSSGEHGNNTKMRAVWRALMEAGADVVLTGHDHNYERFDPQDAQGKPTPNGLREFVIGTGGTPEMRPFGLTKANSVVRNPKRETWGVLKLTLHPTGYDWEFIATSDQSFKDSGSANCIDPGP